MSIIKANKLNLTSTCTFNECDTGTISTSTDSLIFIDSDDSNTTKKVTITALADAMAGSGINSSGGVFTATGSGTDINGQTTIANPLEPDDEFIVYDSSASTNRKVSYQSMVGGMYYYVAAPSGSYSIGTHALTVIAFTQTTSIVNYEIRVMFEKESDTGDTNMATYIFEGMAKIEASNTVKIPIKCVKKFGNTAMFSTEPDISNVTGGIQVTFISSVLLAVKSSSKYMLMSDS